RRPIETARTIREVRSTNGWSVRNIRTGPLVAAGRLRWGYISGSWTALLTREQVFDRVLVASTSFPCVLLRGPMKDAGTKPRSGDRFDSGPLWQPGADQGGRAAAHATMVERNACRSPHRDRWLAARPRCAFHRQRDERQAHSRTGAAGKRDARVRARGGDRRRRIRSVDPDFLLP